LPADLSHVDARGRARMVRVGDKPVTERACVARAEVRMAPATLARIADGTVAKGDVFATARIAAVQAAKRTGEWIPLCHPLALDGVDVELRANAERSCVEIEVRVEAHARTGVEMEALVAASAAGLTIYDMCKAVDRAMTVERVRLVAKRGGKSGSWERPDEAPAAEPGPSPRG
jgi:cyclic pyranopterin monophosphate synthase